MYCRVAHGTADEVGALVRADGGVADEQVVADADACAELLRASPFSNGKVGVFGSCSGGRHAYLKACRSEAFAAVVDLWGGGVVWLHIYPDAGHGFFCHQRPAMYRAEQAVDGWNKVFAFMEKHLA